MFATGKAHRRMPVSGDKVWMEGLPHCNKCARAYGPSGMLRRVCTWVRCGGWWWWCRRGDRCGRDRRQSLLPDLVPGRPDVPKAWSRSKAKADKTRAGRNKRGGGRPLCNSSAGGAGKFSNAARMATATVTAGAVSAEHESKSILGGLVR